MKSSYTDLLQLSVHEQKVLASLPLDGGLGVSEVSRISKVPRMSVYLALTSLKKRGVAFYDRKGKRRFWKKLSDLEFSNHIKNSAKEVFDSKDRVEVTHGENSGFVILRGLSNLFTIFERVAEGHKGQRLLGIQPTSSMKHVVNKLSWDTLKPIQDAIRDNKIIVEGLLREDYYPTLLSLLKTSGEKKQAIESLTGRLTDMVLVSDHYLDSETELMMFKDVAFLVNWKDEVALEIRNKEMLGFMKEIFDLSRGYGKKIDQNEYLRKLRETVI